MLTELTQSQIEEVLTNNYIGRIGFRDDEAVHIMPVNYQFKPGYVQCYSLAGEKVQAMRRHPDVCFEVEEIADNEHWTTVVCWGHYEEITDEAELQLLRPQYTEYMLRMRASISAPPPGAEGQEKHHEDALLPQVFYRIRIAKWSGRRAKVM